MARTYHLYMMASRKNGTIYTGVTGDLAARAYQHRTGKGSSFTSRYGVTRLVHVEEFGDVHEAIAREKAIKKWRRAWKVNLIERDNPEWNDLFEVILRPPCCHSRESGNPPPIIRMLRRVRTR